MTGAVHTSAPARRWQIVAASGRTARAADEALQRLADRLPQDGGAPIELLGASADREELNHRRALVCRLDESAAQLIAGGDARVRGSEIAASRSPRVHLLCNGMGDQHRGMGAALYRDEPAFRHWVDRIGDLFVRDLGVDPREILCAEVASIDPRDALRALVQRGRTPAIDGAIESAPLAAASVFTFQYALIAVLSEWGVKPASLAGHSFGEYVAAAVAGVFALEDAVRIVGLRSQLAAGTPRGGMVAVQAGEDEVRRHAGGDVAVAAVNGPLHTVLAGSTDALDAAVAALTSAGFACRQLNTAHAFHSPHVAPLRTGLERELQGVRLGHPRIPLVSSVSGTWLPADEARDPSYWGRHLADPARFGDSLTTLLADPDAVLLDIGPGRALSSLALLHPDCRPQQRSRIVAATKSGSEPGDESERLVTAAARLWLAGVPIDWTGFWRQQP